MRPRALLVALFTVANLGCREDAQSPTAPESSPTLAATATTALAFYQMSAGNDHTCGLTTDDRAFCWGFRGLGTVTPVGLGDGSTNGSLTPVPVAGGLRFALLSAGYGASCGVTLDHRAFCWGANGRGELGDGTTTYRLKPVAVAGGVKFRQIDITFQHTCAVSYPDHRAYCWGDNVDGQLGDGTRTERRTPVPVAGTLLFRQVTTGYNHTCGVTLDNRLYCWGTNTRGQVGDSSTVRRLKPVRVDASRQWRQVDAARNVSCAVTTDDRAFCWGDGSSGQVGSGGTVLRWPKPVVGGLRFSRVTTGGAHTCGEATNDRAYCWGNDGLGQLGDGTNDNTRAPVAVVGGLTFAQVSAGTLHTCGKTPASVAYCWGTNFRGELGNGTTGKSSTPVAVAGPT